MSKENLTWDQTLRFRLLEIVLQWEGRLTTNHLCNAFNIGRQQASKDINRYIGKLVQPNRIGVRPQAQGLQAYGRFQATIQSGHGQRVPAPVASGQGAN